jgi:hypothetical protein
VIYAVIPVLLAVICVWLGRRMATALLILGYLSIEGFLKLLSNYNRVVHVGLDIVVLSLALVLVLQAVMQRRAHLDELPYTKLILAYAVWMILQLLNPFSPGLVQSVASFKTHLTMVPLYFIGATLFEKPRDIIKFIFGITLIHCLPYGMALVQYALGPTSVLDLSPRFWQNISYYHEWRPFGTSAVPGGTSVFAYLITPLALVLLVAPVRHMIKPLAMMSIALAMGTFVVSGVRQVFLGCVLAILVMAALQLSRRRSRIAFVAALAVAISAGAYIGVQTYLRPLATEAVLRDPFAPDIWRERDVTTRLMTLTNTNTYREARDNPIKTIAYRAQHYPFGAGLGRTGSAAGAFQKQIAQNAESMTVQADVGWTADNFWADMIVEGGVPAAIMLTWILFGMMHRAYKLAREAEDKTISATAAALAGFYFSIAVMSWGSQPLLGNPITAYFWFLSGMCAAMQRMETRAAAEAQEADADIAAELAPAGVR